MNIFFESGAEGYALAEQDTFNKVIDEIANDYGTAVNPTLLQSYSGNLLKGVRGVFGDIKYGDRHYDILNRLERNVARFAAYKAYHATVQVKRALTAKGTAEEGQKRASAVLTAFNRYQSAEYNTAVSRSRTAKQWLDFNDDDAMLLFPNLRWLPSRSASPREQHMPYYNHVWAKSDPFWASNQPGNLWNCKCDWEETSDAPDADKVKALSPPASLEGNPGITGEAFTDNAVYFTANSHEKASAAILEAGEQGFYAKTSIKDVKVKAHILHEAGEIAGNMEVASIFCRYNNDVRKIILLPNVTKENEALRKNFYPKNIRPRGTNNNADAIIEWEDKRQWLVDFKCMQGSGKKLLDRLNDAYQQADYSIVKIKSEIFDINKLTDVAEKFMKGHHQFKGLVIYDNKDVEILKILR